MSNFKNDIEQQLTSLGREIQQFVERITPLDDSRDFSPACDVIESKEKLKIVVDLPGMEKKDVKLTLKNGVLRVEGLRELYLEEDETLLRSERAQGSFIRSFSVPGHADSSAVNAFFKNGELSIEIKKQGDGDPEPDSIPIQ
ncbi:MAG: Hsp20/alpha crystallin family protein [Balneolaceae bacterium]